MNPIIPFMAASTVIAAGAIDSSTPVPLGSVLGSAATIFLVGMWVSRKVTKFEEQQLAHAKRLDLLDARLCAMDDKMTGLFDRVRGQKGSTSR